MFAGTYTVLITPFAADGSLDERALREHVDWQITEGVHGLIPNGSTGEFLCLSDDERRRVAEIVVEQAGGRLPVLVGTGAESTADAIAWTRHAEAIGADGAMIIPPFYSRPDDEEIVAHYTAIAASVRFPIMIYNNPSTAGVDLLPPLLAFLSRVENLQYVKESTFDVRRVRDIVELCGERMHVFGGILAYESFCLGAVGWVAVCSNIVPRLSAQLSEHCMAGAYPEALALYRRLLPLLAMLEAGKYVQIPKAALALLGRQAGEPRAPRLPLAAGDRERLAGILRDLDLDVQAVERPPRSAQRAS